MIKHIVYLLFFGFAGVLTASAAPQLETTRIQVVVPPVKDLKLTDNQRIAIIANIYPDTRNDSLIRAKYPTDSLLSISAALALKDKLEESPVFADYEFPVYNFQRDDTKQLQLALSMDVARQMAADIEADYLFTVDIVNTDIWYDIAYKQQDGTRISYASTTVPYQFIFRYYDITNSSMEDTYFINDTLVIETSSPTVTDAMQLFKEIMTGSRAVIAACEDAGKKYGERITPHWIEEIRYYYNDGSRDMERASNYVEAGRWGDAADIWMKYSGSSNQNQAAMACFNMALACEMADNVTLAFDWLALAVKKNPDLPVREYEQILQKRVDF